MLSEPPQEPERAGGVAPVVAERDSGPTISVIVPVHNDPELLRRCLAALFESEYRDFECIVADDSSTDETPEVAAQFPVRVLRLSGGPFGPAYARNRGAEVSRGSILSFLDADVLVTTSTLSTLAEAFAANPDVDAIFGSYDDSPARTDFLSLYKNLFHHFVHQQASPDAVTFWSGCGAVRREAFFGVGGYDEEQFPRPSIEDIELGQRLRASGRRIMFHKALQVKHLKRWTLRSLIEADVLARGIPWTKLILQRKSLPNALNLATSQRASALLVCVILLYLGLVSFFHSVLIMPLLFGLALVVAGNWSDIPPHFRMSPKARASTYLMMGLIAVLAVYLHSTRMLFPLGLLLGGLLVDRLWPHSSASQRIVLFGGIVVALASSLALLMSSFSIRLSAPLLLIVFAILGINFRLYVFFARRQGLFFALAVVPFHLFYYFYSVVAFALGVVAYARDGLRVKRGGTAAAAATGVRAFAKPDVFAASDVEPGAAVLAEE